jgi:hypothetical protein
MADLTKEQLIADAIAQFEAMPDSITKFETLAELREMLPRKPEPLESHGLYQINTSHWDTWKEGE